jgi:glyceraldehyde 3-phosphate dehydrogenase
MVRVAINGGGRIGRIAMRLALAHFHDLEIVAVNDPFADPKSFAYLLKFDSVHGRFAGDVVAKEDGVEINGKFVKFFTERSPKNINWNSLDVDVVFECSGVFKGQGEDSAGGHCSTEVNNKVKLVIISCPADEGVPTFVMGVNHTTFEKNMKVVSNASCTTNCLAPIAKVLNDNWGLESGLMTVCFSFSFSFF